MTEQGARKALKQVARDILSDLESGYIANPGGRAEQRRRKYERRLRELLTFLDGADGTVGDNG